MALSTIKANSIDDGAITNDKIANTTIDVTSKITGAVPVANGGSAATSASAARTALGVAVGSDVQAFDSDNAVTDAQQTFSKAQIGSTYTAALSTTSGVLDFELPLDFFEPTSKNDECLIDFQIHGITALVEANINLGSTYPLPLVDLKTSREKALLAFKSI